MEAVIADLSGNFAAPAASAESAAIDLRRELADELEVAPQFRTVR
jgi:hypothetical protein